MNNQSALEVEGGGACCVFTLGPLRPASRGDRKTVCGAGGMEQVEGDVADRHILITPRHALHLPGSALLSARRGIRLLSA